MRGIGVRKRGLLENAMAIVASSCEVKGCVHGVADARSLHMVGVACEASVFEEDCRGMRWRSSQAPVMSKGAAESDGYHRKLL